MHRLLVPGLRAAPPPGVDRNALPRFPALERCYARGRALPAPGRLEELLMGLFGLEASQGAAPFCYLADTGKRPDTGVLRASPVHLRADRDQVLLFPMDASQLNMDEARALADGFNGHFADDGLVIEVPSPHRWYLLTERLPKIPFAALDEVAGRSLAGFLPGREKAGFWLGVINETQMLFFDSPVNRAREGRGELPVNGLWFDGAGRLPPTLPGGVRPIHGDHCLLRGLAACASEPGEDSLVLFGDIQAALGAVDAAAWLEAMKRLESLLSPLMKKEDIMLYPCDGRSWHWKPSLNRHFWRLPRPLRFGGEGPESNQDGIG